MSSSYSSGAGVWSALALSLAVALTACGCDSSSGVPAATPAAAPADLSGLPAPIAAAYRTHTAALPAGRAIAYDLTLFWGGNERFGGRITQTPSMDRLVMRRGSDGAELRYDGQTVALLTAPGADSAAVWNRARFDAFTWPYFFAAPMKLADPGTRWAAPRDYPWADGQPAPAAKLTFAPGTGDAPDDYYVVFPDQRQRIAGMAYVVTFGKPDADVAELTPHAIRYHDYRDVDGVPVAHRWTFHNWTAAGGLEAEVLGEATLSDVRFVDVEQGAYATAGGVAVGR